MSKDKAPGTPISERQVEVNNPLEKEVKEENREREREKNKQWEPKEEQALSGEP